MPPLARTREEPRQRGKAAGDRGADDGRLPSDGEGVGEDRDDREGMARRSRHAEDVREPEHAETDEDDVLSRDGEKVVEPRCLERVPESRIDAFVGAEHDAGHERPALAGGSECESSGDCRAQPVADASYPAPPANATPGPARREDDMNAPAVEPPALVESGLGPTRGDRARPELEHGTLRRRPAGR